MTSIDKLVEDFELLGDWDARFQYIMELGEKLPEMPAEDKTEVNAVEGCNSNVWIKAGFTDGHSGVFEFAADSDAHMVRGMLSLIKAIYGGKTAQEVLDIDMMAFVTRTGLMEQLSPARQNGLNALIGKIRGLAADHIATHRS